MQKNKGILLKNYSPYKQKISIFDKTLGRIEALVKQTTNHLPLNNGTLLSYYIEPTISTLFIITALEIEHIPFDLAKKNIQFLHHILELCYQFLPLHCTYLSTFELIETAFKRDFNNPPLVLLRFFVALGIYPEELPFEKTYFLHLLSSPFETIIKEKLDDAQLKMLESWLIRCIEMHPYKNRFKTHYTVTNSYEKT